MLSTVQVGGQKFGFQQQQNLKFDIQVCLKKKSREEKKKLDKIANGVPVGFSVHVLAHFYDPS